MARGKTIAWWSAGGAAVVLVTFSFICRDLLREQWYFWKLESNDENERQHAIIKLSELQSARAIARLVELGTESDAVTFVTLSQALSNIGEKAIPALIEATKTDNKDLQDFSFSQLGKLGWSAHETVPFLAMILKDENCSRLRRYQAAETLGRIGQAAGPTLIDALKSQRQEVRWAVAFGLSYAGHRIPQGVPALIQALKDSDPAVIVAAATALREMAPVDQDALPPLRGALVGTLKNSDPAVRVAAVCALAGIAKRVHGTLEPLIEALSDKETRVRRCAAQTIAQFDSEAEPAVSRLVMLLKDEDMLTRDAAATALGNIGAAARSAIPALEELRDAPVSGRFAFDREEAGRAIASIRKAIQEEPTAVIEKVQGKREEERE